MKKSTVAQKMRWVAGALYLLLCLYQVFIIQTVLLGAGPGTASFVWVAAVLLIPIAGIMSLWMFGGDSVLKAGLRRAVVVGTGWFVIAELITYTEQTKMIQYTLSSVGFLQPLYNIPMAPYFFYMFRLLVMILAAFFVANVSDSMDYRGKKNEATGDFASREAGAEKGKGSAAAAAADLDKPLEVPKKEEPKAAAPAAPEAKPEETPKND